MGVGGGWEAEGGLYHPLEQEQGHCVFNEAQGQPSTGQPQCTYMSNQDDRWQQFDTTRNLLVCPSGITYPAVDHHGFIGSENAACESRPGYLQP